MLWREPGNISLTYPQNPARARAPMYSAGNLHLSTPTPHVTPRLYGFSSWGAGYGSRPAPTPQGARDSSPELAAFTSG
jgi:hypothetical protein